MRVLSKLSDLNLVLSAAAILLFAETAISSTLSVSTVQARPGDKNVKVGISLANDSAYAGMEFSLSYDPSFLRVDSISPAARILNQTGNGHNLIGRGAMQFLVFDFGGNAISADSGALFDVYFNIDSIAPDSLYSLSLSDIAAVTPSLQYDSLTAHSGVIEVIGTAVPNGHQNDLPRTFSLRQNYPNPFNPSTVIEYQIPAGAHVKVTIFNVLGQRVKTLWDADREAGNYRLTWDGTNSGGTHVSSGVYFYRIEAGSFRASKKMVLLK